MLYPSLQDLERRQIEGPRLRGLLGSRGCRSVCGWAKIGWRYNGIARLEVQVTAPAALCQSFCDLSYQSDVGRGTCRQRSEIAFTVTLKLTEISCFFFRSKDHGTFRITSRTRTLVYDLRRRGGQDPFRGMVGRVVVLLRPCANDIVERLLYNSKTFLQSRKIPAWSLHGSWVS